MKKLFAVSLLAFSLTAFADETKTNAPASEAPVKIPAAQAKSHIGVNAIVTGKVAEVNQNDRILRFNIDKPFPANSFTAVVFSQNTNQFKNAKDFQGKTVEISGIITDYRGHPEIVMTRSNQLQAVETPADKHE